MPTQIEEDKDEERNDQQDAQSCKERHDAAFAPFARFAREPGVSATKVSVSIETLLHEHQRVQP